MRIILLLNHDIYATYALNLLLDSLKNHQIKIFLSSKVGSLNNHPEKLLELKNCEQNLMQELFEKIDNEGLVSEGKLLTFKQIAQHLNSQISTIENINSSILEAKITEFECDLIISIRFGQILQPNIIKLSRLGVINLHSGLMPRYRGVMSSFWAILNGEKQIGTTLHYITDSKIDNGPIISQSFQAVDFKRSFMFNVINLYKDGCRMITDFLNHKKSNVVAPLSTSSQYYPYPTASALTSFEKIMPLFNEEDVKKIYSWWN